MASENKCDGIPALDAYSPREMACKAERVGVGKANLGVFSTFLLAVLAGAFIAAGACFYTTVVTGAGGGIGPTRLLGALAFCLGLILVVVTGAELFTGNTLIFVAFISKKVSFLRLMRNWAIVYVGNLVGSLATAGLVYYAWQWKMGKMAVGVSAYNIAGAKLNLPFMTDFCSGILCNALVCLGVWLCYSARSTTDKILSVIFPVSAFVTLGFEHSVANMYLIPYAIALSHTSSFMSNASVTTALKFDPSLFTLGNFVMNLIPVTLGNIVGGSVLVGAFYWMVHLREESPLRSKIAASETHQPDGRRKDLSSRL